MRKHRGILPRALAASLVVWLGLVITDPLSLDACPMHGAHATHATHAVTVGHAEHRAPPTHGSAPKKASNQCTCIGDCSLAGGTSFALLANQVPAPAALITVSADETYASAIVLRAGPREHALPPALGPPAIS